MEYHLAAEADLEAVVAMRLAFLEEDSGGLTAEQRLLLSQRLPPYFQRHLGRDLTVYAAWDGAKMAATAYLLAEAFPPNLRYPTGMRGTVLNVYTAPPYRRRGLAGRLVSMAVEDGRRLGLSRLELQATAQGAPVYRSVGFMAAASRLLSMEYPLAGEDRI